MVIDFIYKQYAKLQFFEKTGMYLILKFVSATHKTWLKPARFLVNHSNALRSEFCLHHGVNISVLRYPVLSRISQMLAIVIADIFCDFQSKYTKN